MTRRGDRQANDPKAMPLDEFMKEVMDILQTQPDAAEIKVQLVISLRFTAGDGQE